MNIFKVYDGKCNLAGFQWNFTILKLVTELKCLVMSPRVPHSGPGGLRPRASCVRCGHRGREPPQQLSAGHAGPAGAPRRPRSRDQQLTTPRGLQTPNRSARHGGCLPSHLASPCSAHVVSNLRVKALAVEVKDGCHRGAAKRVPNDKRKSRQAGVFRCRFHVRVSHLPSKNTFGLHGRRDELRITVQKERLQVENEAWPRVTWTCSCYITTNK